MKTLWGIPLLTRGEIYCAKYLYNNTNCADLQCILFIVLSDQTGNITVKMEAVTSGQDKGLVQTNRERNLLSG